jgi:hypothetical protein
LLPAEITVGTPWSGFTRAKSEKRIGGRDVGSDEYDRESAAGKSYQSCACNGTGTEKEGLALEMVLGRGNPVVEIV